MDVKTVNEGLYNTKTWINGQEFQIDSNGVIWGIDEERGRKVLTMASWVLWDGEKTQAVIPKAPPPPLTPAPAPIPENVPQPPEQPEEEEGKEGPEEEEEEDWPDPDMSMSKADLQAMAEAYELDFDDQTTKKELIDLIMAERYPEEG